MTIALAGLSLAIWLYLLLLRGGFWRCRERDGDDAAPAPTGAWPSVAAIVPARNEAAVLRQSIGALLAQDYPGPFSIVVVDDESDDGTAETARRCGRKTERAVTVLKGLRLPPGWTGKVWAQQQGIAWATAGEPAPDYLLLTDADIVHAPDSLMRLVTRARAGSYVLTSLMAKLRCESPAERALVPAFVFFFAMLYPFRWVNRREDRTAAAAGGAMLVKRRALEAAGGIGVIRGALIDDCALAKAMKAHGPIWLGLTERVRSIRPYPRFADIGRMVARSAYAQLGYSPAILAGTGAGMAVTYLSPPLIAVFGSFPANTIAAAAWAAMALAFLPMLRLYGRSPLWGFALPAIAAAYLAFTLTSAYQHWQGRGGYWKGRAQAISEKP